MGVISLESKLEFCSSSNCWDMDIWISKRAITVKPIKPNLLSFVWQEYLCQEGQLDNSNTKICPLVMILPTFWNKFFNSIYDHHGGSCANDPIILGRLIQLLKHLECENLSIIQDSLGRAWMVQQFWRRRSWNTTEKSCLRGFDVYIV